MSVRSALETSPPHLAQIADRLRQVTVEIHGTDGAGAGILWAPDLVVRGPALRRLGEMSRDRRPGTVIVCAQDAMQAARLEAALHELAGWRIHVCTPPQLRSLVDEHPRAIVAMVLPDADTRRMLRAVRAWPLRPAVITLSEDPAQFPLSAARTPGLRAALPLRATAEELAGAVRAVHAGLFVLHPEAVERSMAGDTATAPGAPLTSRERGILELMADGANNRIIAARLGISRHTVKFHVASILAKLDARSRTEAVAMALRAGLLAV